MKHCLSNLTLAIFSITLLPTAQAQEFNNFVSFGDSLSDSGYFTNFNPALQKFTTNPDKVWTQVLAESYGTTSTANSNGQVGNNYAAGGALASIDIKKHPDLGIPVPSAKTQINTYLTSHTPSPHTLYSVWIGSNDLLGIGSMSPTPDPLTALTITNQAATDAANAIQTLSDKGAKLILVPNIPDVGLSPAARATGTEKQSTLLATQYNGTLYKTLDKGTANIVPIDTFTMLQEVVANPSAYGLTNVQAPACGAISSILCDKANLSINTDEYLFADGVHPTGIVHNLIAQHAKNVLEAPHHFAQVSNTVNQSGYVLNSQLNRRLNHVETGTYNIWTEGSFLKQHTDSITNHYENDANTSAAIVGLGVPLNADSSTGFYLQQHQGDYSSGKTVGYDIEETGLGFYHRHNIGNNQINLHLGMANLDIDWERDVKLGKTNKTHTANSGGQRKQIGLQIGHQFDFSTSEHHTKKATVTPYAGMLMQKLRINSLSENNPESSSAISFKAHDIDSSIGTIGIRADYPMNETISFSGNLSYNHNFKNNDQSITTGIRSIKNHSRGFDVPVSSSLDEDYFALSLGVNAHINDSISLQIGASADGEDSDDYQTGAYLGLNASF